MTPHTSRFLLSGTLDAVISQSPRDEARETVEALLKLAKARARGETATVGGRVLPLQIIVRENIPAI